MSDLAWPGESHETAHHMLERIIDEYVRASPGETSLN